MTYQPNIPQATDDLSDSQANLLANFQVSNTVMSVDHYPFDDATANKGFHKQVHLTNSTPTLGGANGVLGCSSGWPVWVDGAGNTVNLINGEPNTANPGYTYLPGNMIMQWGSGSTGSGGTGFTTVTFPIAFGTLYSFVATANGSTVIGTGTSGATSCLVSTRRAISPFDLYNTSFFWMAIGHI
jgi:hypothetical protein